MSAYNCGQLGSKATYSTIPAGGAMAAAVGASTGKCRLRVVHNVANGPDLDGYLNSGKMPDVGNTYIRPVLQHFSYKTISEYLEINAGTRLLVVQLAGTQLTPGPSPGEFILGSQPIVFSGTADFASGRAYTLILHGTASPLVVLPLLVEDNFTCPPPGKAHVRFIHAAAGIPTVNIYANGSPAFKGVQYKTVAAPHYLVVDAGTVNVSIHFVGNERPDLGPIPIRVNSGRIYTIIASGIVKDPVSPVAALVSEDSKGACIITGA